VGLCGTTLGFKKDDEWLFVTQQQGLSCGEHQTNHCLSLADIITISIFLHLNRTSCENSVSGNLILVVFSVFLKMEYTGPKHQILIDT
jgi:hypothetical protein